jgi:hypothetical protein
MEYWKVFCEETEFHGLWPRWFRDQCAAVGWNPERGFMMEGKARKQDWARARNCLKDMQPGDMLRWDLNIGSIDPDTAVKLPSSSRLPMHLARPTILFSGIESDRS